MAKRSFLKVVGVVENLSTFTCDHGESYALFGEGGGAALAEAVGAPLVGRVPLEPAVAAGGDSGNPVSLDDAGAAAEIFRAIAERITDEISPPVSAEGVDMEGCSARLFDTVNEAFAKIDGEVEADTKAKS